MLSTGFDSKKFTRIYSTNQAYLSQSLPINQIFKVNPMKEDLIVIPDIKEFKDLISDARSELSELELSEEEGHRRELALDVVEILEGKLAKTSDINKLDIKEKIWFASHLYFLETILEDLFEPFDEDMMFYEEDEVEEEEEEEKK